MKFFSILFGRQPKRAIPESSGEFASAVSRRLREEFALLQELEFERDLRADRSYGQATEDRIIWRELFDLELQELDEQITRRPR